MKEEEPLCELLHAAEEKCKDGANEQNDDDPTNGARTNVHQGTKRCKNQTKRESAPEQGSVRAQSNGKVRPIELQRRGEDLKQFRRASKDLSWLCGHR